MHYVKNVVESGILFFRNHQEILQKNRFRNSMWLSQYNIVFSWEKFKCVFNEIRTSALKSLVNTKQINDKSVYFLLWYFRDLI
jgi:hypothetical protein